MIYRNLTENEISTLQANSCWAEDWQRIEVSEDFEPRFLHGVMFYGDIRLGAFTNNVEVSRGFMKHAGVNNATLRNVTIGNNCLIENISGYINNYIIGDDCITEEFDYADVDHLGSYRKDLTYNQKHIDSVLALDLVDVEAIRKANFRVAIDCVNSVGGIILPELLKQLGVQHIEKLYCEPTGDFQHNPEPLEKNLGDIMNLMKGGKADVAFVVDPDVDRLAMICEDGKMYGEEYTLVSVADYVLKHTPGNTVSNLSSTRALRDVTRKYGKEYFASAVGEVNVTTKMKEVGAVIGGEGNGGVIYPESHYGRDALVGIALFLSHLAHEGKKVSELRATYPSYFMAKNRVDLTPETDVDAILQSFIIDCEL